MRGHTWTSSRIRRTTLCFALALTLCSCGTKSEIVYTGPVSASQETEGFPRLADNEARVNVAGTEKVGELRQVGGWFVVHPEHLKRFVRNTAKLARIRQAKTLEEVRAIVLEVGE